MPTLAGRVAIVAGGTRGAGRGIALALGDAGATVYVTGRSSRRGGKPKDGSPETVEDAAAQVTKRGGRGIAVRVDHTREPEVRRLFERVDRDEGRLDVLVNAVWGGNEDYRALGWGKPFWTQPTTGWPQMMEAGVLAYLLASREALPRMKRRKRGLIVCVLDGINVPYRGHMYWDLAHLCMERMIFGMHPDVRDDGVVAMGVSPGFMRTERVQRILRTKAQRHAQGYDRSESTEYVGRGIAAVAADPRGARWGGKLVHSADLADYYGFTDIDGRRVPRFVVANP